ncbi:hypothetical protein CPB83DRAFT_858534 [Crepidotus variabilis]|uniref:Uncharacterized protein n=1 Tax=Crepidotus variabilis TaxID=179855 RepID=A0A9P6EBI3_9AGAR|nr:hypothetical protein CPB83DRAFT_858534 [Crepidotus variabilis]
MAARPLAQKLTSIAESWVKDPFRPNLQLSTLLNSLAAHSRLTKQAVESARALRDNGMMKKYPLTQKMLDPASRPQYYQRLVEGYEKSAQGIARPWWKGFFGIW